MESDVIQFALNSAELTHKVIADIQLFAFIFALSRFHLSLCRLSGGLCGIDSFFSSAFVSDLLCICLSLAVSGGGIHILSAKRRELSAVFGRCFGVIIYIYGRYH